MKHEFKNKDGVETAKVGLSTGNIELKCLRCGDWVRVVGKDTSCVNGCRAANRVKTSDESEK